MKDNENKFNSTAYKNQFQKEKYDRIIVNVAKGERDKLKEKAIAQKLSLNGFFVKAVKYCIENNINLSDI